MGNFKEYKGKTIDEAIDLAVLDLLISRENLKYEVLDKGKLGFLGSAFGAKPAIIKVDLDYEVDLEENDCDINQEQEIEIVVEEDIECINVVDIKEENKKDKIVTKKYVVSDEIKLEIKDELLKILKFMNIEADIELKVFDKTKIISININNVTEEDKSILIGKRGKTLDSLQYIIGILVNKRTNTFYNVKLDIGDYRERRKKTLENLARNLAKKCKYTNKKIEMNYMNAYERKIIHTTLQNDKYVETYSEGKEPYRRVCILPKKNKREDLLVQKENEKRREYK